MNSPCVVFQFYPVCCVPEGTKPTTAFMFKSCKSETCSGSQRTGPLASFYVVPSFRSGRDCHQYCCSPLWSLRVPHTRFLDRKTRSLAFTQRLHSCTYMLFCVFRTSDLTFVLLGQGFIITQFLLNPLLISGTHSPLIPQHGSMAALAAISRHGYQVTGSLPALPGFCALCPVLLQLRSQEKSAPRAEQTD